MDSIALCHVEAAIALPSLASGILEGLTLTGVAHGRGLILVYPFFWVPTHPRRALGASTRGNIRGELSSYKYQGRTSW